MKGKILFFIISFFIVLILGALIWSPNGLLNLNSKDDLANIAVEFHGMIFDVILFGIILTIYEYYSDNKQKRADKINAKILRIERYKEELEDYKGWKGEEAAFRVAGIVKRLLKEEVEDIDLSDLHVGQLVQIVGDKGRSLIEDALKNNKSFCSLEGADLRNANLEGVSVSGINMTRINLVEANLKGADLRGVNLQRGILYKANLKGVKFGRSNLESAVLGRANLEDASLRGTNMKRVDLSNANLKGADLTFANLEGADLSEGIEEIWVEPLSGPAPIRSKTRDGFMGADLEGARLLLTKLKGAKASKFQRNTYSKVMTNEQLDLIVWGPNPGWYKDDSKNINPSPEINPRCTAKKRNGSRCTRNPRRGYDKCTQHLKMRKEL